MNFKSLFVKIKNIVRSFVNRQLFSPMTSVEEVDQLDSGMGSSDAHSPEVKSLLPDDEDDEEVKKALCYYKLLLCRFNNYT